MKFHIGIGPTAIPFKSLGIKKIRPRISFGPIGAPGSKVLGKLITGNLKGAYKEAKKEISDLKSVPSEIAKGIKNFGGYMKGFGNTDYKTTTERIVPPPSTEEKSLLANLLNATNDYYKPSQDYLNVLAKHYEPSQEFIAEMKNPYLSMLPYQEKFGDLLNQFASRGVINSTITQDAMKELGQSLAERGRELRWQTLSMLEQARQRELQDESKRALMEEEARRMSLQDHYNQMYKLWATLYSGRMGVPTTITTQKGPNPWSSVLAQALGTGLGAMLYI